MPPRETPARDAYSTPSLAARLWRDYLGRYWRRLLLSLLAMGVYAASASAIPLGVEWITSAFSGEENRFGASLRDVLVLGPALVLALGLANALAQYVQTRLSLSAALSALRDMQNHMFRSLTALDFAEIRRRASGQTISTFTNDALVLRETLTRASAAVRDALTLVGLCLMMLYYDWLLFLIVAAVYPAIGWPVAHIGRYLRKSSGDAQTQAGEVVSLIGESVAGARMVKAYGLESYQASRAEGVFAERLRLLKKIANMRALNEPFIFFVGSAALAVVIAAVAWRISVGALNTEQFISFIIALLLMSQPARGLGTLNAVMQEGFGAFERMARLIDAKPAVIDRPGAEELAAPAGRVTFENVTFHYARETPALAGFSLDIPAGATVALVGESGAGKSTVFDLLLRLYDTGEGVIRIDGRDIAGVTLASLRRATAVVNQDTVLFNDTVRANIAFGRAGAGETEIVAAAKAAAVHDFIETLPQKYDTMVDEGGGNLSGGQRQRLALARAFLKDAPILLLDEATSALDAESEQKVQQGLAALSRGRTTIVIAHRLATVRAADLIAVMKEGRIIELGAHDDLMARSGIYARLAEMQFRDAVTA